MNRFTRMTGSLLACLLFDELLRAGEFDWPQWRGPDRTDVSKEKGLLKAWPSAGPRRVWLFENAGEGYAGPALADGKLFTMGTRSDS